MEVRDTKFGGRELFGNYVAQINWDWLFLRAKLVFSAILFLGMVGFALWFMQ